MSDKGYTGNIPILTDNAKSTSVNDSHVERRSQMKTK